MKFDFFASVAMVAILLGGLLIFNQCSQARADLVPQPYADAALVCGQHPKPGCVEWFVGCMTRQTLIAEPYDSAFEYCSELLPPELTSD